MRKYKIVNEDDVNKYFSTMCFLVFSNEAEAEVKKSGNAEGCQVHSPAKVCYCIYRLPYTSFNPRTGGGLSQPRTGGGGGWFQPPPPEISRTTQRIKKR